MGANKDFDPKGLNFVATCHRGLSWAASSIAGISIICMVLIVLSKPSTVNGMTAPSSQSCGDIFNKSETSRADCGKITLRGQFD
jgi:hypothetical protein